MQTFKIFNFFLLCFLIIFLYSNCLSQEKKFVETDSFDAKEARQGIAVDEKYVYVIGTREIGKYDKKTHQLIKHWQGKKGGQIIHLDSGVIVDGKLYCAHSNYPRVPMTSSVEIWNAETLKHINSHSFGIHWGSCTWVDYFEGFWWVTFAHYEKWKEQTGKGTEWTTLVKFDDHWHYLAAWIYPDELIQRFRPMSNSGGSWGPDALLYCTGHDHAEVYVLQIPHQGSVLELIEIIPINILGQGIAWDRSGVNIIYGIRKKDRKVVLSKMIYTKSNMQKHDQ